MKSLTAVRKKSPNYPVEFKIKMVELSHRPEISVAQLAREHGINDNLLFKWRQYWREGKLRPPSTTENNVPELLPITLDAEDVVPTTSPRSQPVAAATPESLNISCEVTFRHGSLRLIRRQLVLPTRANYTGRTLQCDIKSRLLLPSLSFSCSFHLSVR
ncbi:transposase, partial [Escherichia coli]